MASQFANPLLEPEPFEIESQQPGNQKSAASPDDLEAFYQDMERKESVERTQQVERKLSKRKSNSGTSIWTRKKSVRRSPQQPAPAAAASTPPPPSRVKETEMQKAEREEQQQQQAEAQDNIAPMPLMRSIIPDALQELPAWYRKDDWATIPIPSQRLRYPLHNPLGPRWYRNHHLIPPSQLRAAARPPSVFSPSFPPMASHSHSSQDNSDDIPRRNAPPSRTPSSTPLPTPNSSQTRVAESGPGKRSRKNSETAHDTVDLLDGTDPWGTNWHHKSPYDIGLANGPVSLDVPEGPRSRISSMTYGRRKGVIPSPLSQSTSAVHLQAAVTEPRVNRTLSKRRTATLANLFGAHSSGKDPARAIVSLPATPLGDSSAPDRTFPRPMSTLPPSASSTLSLAAPSQKSKRTSVFGRLARKFSVLRKPSQDTSPVSLDASTSATTVSPSKRESRRHSAVSVIHAASPQQEPGSNTQIAAEVVAKRVAAPQPEPDVPAAAPGPAESPSHDVVPQPPDSARHSISFVDEPFSMGRLTIANPDAPSSRASTPTPADAPVPPDKSDQTVHQIHATENGKAMPELPNEEHVASQIPLHSPSSPEPILPSNLLASGTVAASPVSSPRILESTISPTTPIKSAPQPATVISTPTSQPQVPYNTEARQRGSYEVPAKRASSSRTRSPEASSPKSHTRVSSPPVASESVRAQSPETAPRRENPKHSSRPPASLVANGTVLPTATSAAASRHRKESSSTKPQRERHSSTASVVPFPTANTPTEVTPSYPIVSAMPYPSLDDSPYSTSSVLANPPTPYAPKLSDVSLPPAVPEKTKNEHVKSQSRQTETFKLAAGEQWEVVESKDDKPRESKSKDTASRSESRKRDKPNGETEEERNRLKGSTSKHSPSSKDKSPSGSSSHQRAGSLEGGHYRASSNEPSSSGHKESKSRRKRDEEKTRDRKSDRRSVDAQLPSSSRRVSVDKPHSSPPSSHPATAPSPDVSLERRPSSSTARPNSELSSADLNALRAREAWDMDRLWKAKSMYSPPATTTPLLQPQTGEPSAHSSAAHGSSHTSFMVQTPFQRKPSSQIYHSMPTSPPTIIYCPSSQSSMHIQPSTPDSRPPLSNPLPPPPQMSSYQPAPQAADYLARYKDNTWTTQSAAH